MMEIKYYEINEKAQKDARSMWSFRDYVMGSITSEYKGLVDDAYSQAKEAADENKEQAKVLAERYSRRLADYYNKQARVEMMCPSVMISGAGNFPVRKKERQNAARDRLVDEWSYLEQLRKRIIRLKTYTPPKAVKQGVATKESFDNPYFKVVQNEELNRLQLLFEEKPDEETRSLLKANGYKWSPKNTAWQRQLTPNARVSVRYIINMLKKREVEE